MGIIEQMDGVEGISAVKAIHLANQQGLKTYRVTGSNIATVLPILQVSSAVKGDIQNAVNAGKEVLIPEQELQVNDWRGVGYVISDPETGAAGYLISGGFAGGSGTQPSPPGGLERTIQVIGCLFTPEQTDAIAAAITW